MNWFMNYRVRTRLFLMCLAAILGMGVMNALSLKDLRSSMLEDRKSKIKTQIETASGVILHYRDLAKAGQMPDADARKAAIEALRKVRFDTTEYFFIFNTDYVYQLLDPKPEREGKRFADLKDANGKLILVAMNKAAADGGGFVDYWFPKAGSDTPEPKLSYAALIPDWNWVIGTGVYIDDLNQAFWSKATWLLSELVVLAIALLGVSWLIAASVLRQLGGEPHEGIVIMERVAEGDLLVNISHAPAGSMLATLGKMVGSLRSMISEIATDASTLNSQTALITTSSQQISAAASRQADATTSMAAAMEELTVSITHISDSSSSTESASRQAADLSKSGVKRVGEASASIEQISTSVSQASQQIIHLDDAARQISNIAAVIKDIAGQTNLLALNAAIEAARAGEQGRGFAVVADEVRKLAERTATATVDIEKMLAAVQQETQDVVRVMNEAIPQVDRGVNITYEIASLLNQIHQGAETTLTRLADVASATREQSTASTSIAVQVEDISQMAEETSSSITHTAETAEGIEQIAHNLKEIVSRFKI
ncbi:methyl-accepting chemotaxis protein [Uliginosibacterium gangwonense]|uniref:methyl-accepting chemotaxis protein n=1 Tax=Uliginosibacterium gangwonense TaxID=392736 RepID=UPI000372CD52|nr:methyl-accepting chemotaxis protein [Uliginosibacterium gangwonense]